MMNLYTLGGIICILYTALVFYVGVKRPPSLIKAVKIKINKNMSDQAAVKVCFVAGTLVGIAGIVLFVLSTK